MSKARVKANARRLHSTVQRVEQTPYNLMSTRRIPRAAGGSSHAFCQLSSSLGPATGTWPSITPTTRTGATVYADVNGTLTALPGTYTLRNWRDVTWAASKTTLLLPNSSGGFNVVDQDC